MKVIRNVLKNRLNVRTEMNYPKEGIEFIDIMPLLMEKNIYKEIIDSFVEELTNKKKRKTSSYYSSINYIL